MEQTKQTVAKGQVVFTHPSYNGAVFDRETGALVKRGSN